MPGDNIEMEVELMTPIAMEKEVRFAIREGGRTVGAGTRDDDPDRDQEHRHAAARSRRHRHQHGIQPGRLRVLERYGWCARARRSSKACRRWRHRWLQQRFREICRCRPASRGHREAGSRPRIAATDIPQREHSADAGRRLQGIPGDDAGGRARRRRNVCGGASAPERIARSTGASTRKARLRRRAPTSGP